jgi:hypothetical protein
MKIQAMILTALLMPTLAVAADVTITKKKAWSTAGQSGYVVEYKHDGKIWKNAKVYCVSVGKPIYLIENVDRGDGVKLGISVEADQGGLATEIAPRYMNFAIDLWSHTCK